MSRILIVEDEGIVARSIQSRLEKMGYEVPGIIANGEEVLDAAMTLKPDVVLMDIRLKSHMDGIEAVKLMRQHVQVPVIYLTAYADDETLARAIQTEPNGYIVKPFSQVDLRAAIENAIHKFQVDMGKEKQMRDLLGVLDHINDALILTDKDGIIQLLNRLAMNLTGFKHSAIGQNIHEVIQFLDKGKNHINDLIRQAAEGKKIVELPEVTILSSLGVERVVHLSVVPLYPELAVLGPIACIFALKIHLGNA